MERKFRLNWQALVDEAVKRRKEQGFSQEKLAVLAGISKPTLNAFEQGKKSISIENAMKILSLLGLSD